MDDEQLIRQFMLSAREEVSDSGFSARVMRHIPNTRPFWVFPTAMLLIVAAVIALFIWFDGWSVLCSIFVRVYTIFAYAKHFHFTFNPLYLLVFLGLGCWYLTEKVKKLVY